jgi:hypothetical protein
VSQLAANGYGNSAFAETMSAEEMKAFNEESNSIPETVPDGESHPTCGNKVQEIRENL